MGIGAPELFILLLTLIVMALPVWMLVDVAGRSPSAFADANRGARGLWLTVAILALFAIGLGALVALGYLLGVRPALGPRSTATPSSDTA